MDLKVEKDELIVFLPDLESILESQLRLPSHLRIANSMASLPSQPS